ncbi:MAG: cyclic nucleotide-binding domain-containing protein [Anaerolineae bacterium]|nr:cyclic nucleotide-binding domain-containing protein [Anaerolineae bacterium]
MLHILKNTDILDTLDDDQLERIANICTQVNLAQDTIIFGENTPGDEMYIVVRGTVAIQVDPSILGMETEAGPTTITTLRRGQVFGEVVLVDRGLRTAAAKVAQDNTQLLVLKRDDLLMLCEEDYKLGYLLMRNIAAEMAFKIRGTDLLVREQLLWQPSQPPSGTLSD